MAPYEDPHIKLVIQTNFKKCADEMQVFSNGVTGTTLGQAEQSTIDIQHMMMVEGSEPVYPLPWTKRMRKRWYGTVGFTFVNSDIGGPLYIKGYRQSRKMKGLASYQGLKYERTHQYVNNWNVEPIAGRGFTLSNPLPYAFRVGGTAAGKGQARMFRGRWQLFKDAIDKVLVRLPPEVVRQLAYLWKRVLKND